ncbi:MAG: LETM1 domain-containing protein [Myxococcota bacterium]|jgi:hypothetical protein|nr:LETM1 domain-containing protein [Myxococcota bacterium]
MDWARETWDSLRDTAQDTLARIAIEWSETKDLAPILNKLLQGETISEAEKEEITAQAADMGKIVGLGAVKMIPFAGMPLVALIIYTMQKMDLKPLPSAWDEDPEVPA